MVEDYYVPIRKAKRLNEQVYEYIKQEIINQGLKPGEKIDIEELAAKFNVSVAPVRSSLRSLANEGLVEILPQVGTFVSMLSRKDYEELFKARLMFESFCTSQVAVCANEEDIALLEGIVERASKVFDTESFENPSFIISDLDFHSQVVKLGGGNRIYKLYSQLHCHIQMMKIQYNNVLERATKGYMYHKKILEAIKKRDSELAYKVAYDHVVDTADFFLSKLNIDE